MAHADGVHRKPLHEVRGRLDPPLEKRELPRGVSPRSRSSAGGDSELRSLRAEGRAGLESSTPSVRADVETAFRAEHAAILIFYAARIEAVRRGASPAAIRAAINALVNEQTVALRGLANRRVAAETQEQDRLASRPENQLKKTRGRYGLG
jgi:hypothetical protein